MHTLKIVMDFNKKIILCAFPLLFNQFKNIPWIVTMKENCAWIKATYKGLGLPEKGFKGIPKVKFD